MVTLIEVGWDVAKWLFKNTGRRGAEFIVGRLPESNIQIMTIKDALTDDLAKISDQIRSQSLSKLKSANNFLLEGILKLQSIVENREKCRFLMENMGESVGIEMQELSETELEPVLHWIREAKILATQAFMDKKNIKPDQRLEAMKIMIFCSTIEHWKSSTDTQRSIKISLRSFAEDEELCMIMNNKGKRLLGFSEEPVFRIIQDFIAMIAIYLQRIQYSINRKSSLLELENTLSCFGKIMDKQDVPIFGMKKLINGWFVKPIHGYQVLSGHPPSKVVLASKSKLFLSDFFMSRMNPVDLMIDHSIDFCSHKDTILFLEGSGEESLSMKKLTFDENNNESVPTERIQFEFPPSNSKNIHPPAALDRNKVIVRQNSGGFLRILDLSTGNHTDVSIVSELRRNKILACRKISKSSIIELAVLYDHHAYNLVCLCLDLETHSWSSKRFLKVPGDILKARFIKEGKLFILALHEGSVRMGCYSSFSDETNIELKCRLWSGYGKNDTEVLRKRTSMCMSIKEKIIYVGLQ